LFFGLVLLASVPYLGALDDQFVFDDKVVIAQNPVIKDFDLLGIIGRPYWISSTAAGLYRPLTTLGFATDWAIGRGSPRPFVVTNIVLHVASTLLVFLLFRRLFPRSEGIGMGIAALFAVHPLHVEAVVGIVGRAEVLAGFLTLLSYRIWLDAEKRPASPLGLLPPFLWFGALLAKESAVMLPALLFFHRRGWLPGTSRAGIRKTDSAWAVAFALVLFLRALALGGFHAPVADTMDNPLLRVGATARALAAGGILARQLWQVLTGLNLSADYSYAAIRPGPSLYVAGAVTLAIGAATAVFVFRKAKHSIEAWGLSFFLVFWFITSNLLVPVGTAQADRLLYLPLLGLLAFAVSLLSRLRPFAGRRSLLHVLVALLVVAGAARSIDRTRVWKNERTLYERTIVDEPLSVKARWNLAVVLQKEEGGKSAARVLKILDPIARYAPDHPGMLHRQAVAFMFLGQDAEADSLFRAALRAGTPDSADARIELGNLALQRQDGEMALREFDAVGRMNELPEHVAIGRASALSLLGRYRESAEVWRPLVAQFPDSIPVRAACGYTLREAGDPLGSIAVLDEGLRRGSNPRLVNELARSYLAAHRFDDALRLLPTITDPEVREMVDAGLRARSR
jgi:protein O-mannosyl-transferase